MDNQILLEVGHLVREVMYLSSLQTTVLIGLAGAWLIGLVILGFQLRAVSADLKAIAAMTAEVLRRTPGR